MKFYQYPRCSTCVKARKYLEQSDADFVSIDITEKTPSKAELKNMLKSYGGNIRKLFNTSGMQYRELNMKERLPNMTDAQAIDVLVENGMLIKRPFLIKKSGEGIVGFKQDDWNQFVNS